MYKRQIKLATVNGIGTGCSDCAVQDIGDFAGGIVAMSCSEDTIVLIPFQRILTKIRCV